MRSVAAYAPSPSCVGTSQARPVLSNIRQSPKSEESTSSPGVIHHHPLMPWQSSDVSTLGMLSQALKLANLPPVCFVTRPTYPPR